MPKVKCDNAHLGDVFSVQSQNALVHTSRRVVGLVAVSDLMVSETSNAAGVLDMACSQAVTHMVNQLLATKREEQNLHRKLYRPWGRHNTTDQGSRCMVKRIRVKPKARMSLQTHYHRAEHYIVVTATAEITDGDKVLSLTENQSIHIPFGEVYRLANLDNIPLEIIEVQLRGGAGKDDIVRFQDRHIRN